MNRRVVIGCYTDVVNGGGAACWTRHVARGLGEKGYEVWVPSRGEPTREELKDDAYRIVYFHDDLGWRWRVPAWGRLVQLISEVKNRNIPKPESVLAVSASWVLTARAVWPEVPVVYLFPSMVWRCLPHLHRTSPSFLSRVDDWITKRQERQAVMLADKIVVASRCVGEDIERFVPGSSSKFRFGPTGVDDLKATATLSRTEIRTLLNTPMDGVVAISSGTLDGNKNQAHLLRAFSKVRPGKLWLWILGDGQDRKFLEGLARELGIDTRTRFLGWSRDVENYYLAADVLVHSSWYDCFPNVYLEAMVCGLPVVGPKNEGAAVFSSLEDVITPGREGFVYSLLKPEELVSLLQQFQDRPETLSAMGRSARSLATTTYSWGRYVGLVEQTMNECIGNVIPNEMAFRYS